MPFVRTFSIVLAVALQGIPGGVLHVCRMDATVVRKSCACGHAKTQQTPASTATVRADRCCDIQSTPSVAASVGVVEVQVNAAIAPLHVVGVTNGWIDGIRAERGPIELRPELLPQGPPIYVAVRSLLI